MCRISVRNYVCIPQDTPVIIPYLTEEIMFHISIKTGSATEVTHTPTGQNDQLFFAIYIYIIYWRILLIIMLNHSITVLVILMLTDVLLSEK